MAEGFTQLSNPNVQQQTQAGGAQPQATAQAM